MCKVDSNLENHVRVPFVQGVSGQRRGTGPLRSTEGRVMLVGKEEVTILRGNQQSRKS